MRNLIHRVVLALALCAALIVGLAAQAAPAHAMPAHANGGPSPLCSDWLITQTGTVHYTAPWQGDYYMTVQMYQNTCDGQHWSQVNVHVGSGCSGSCYFKAFFVDGSGVIMDEGSQTYIAPGTYGVAYSYIDAFTGVTWKACADGPGSGSQCTGYHTF